MPEQKVISYLENSVCSYHVFLSADKLLNTHTKAVLLHCTSTGTTSTAISKASDDSILANINMTINIKLQH